MFKTLGQICLLNFTAVCQYLRKEPLPIRTRISQPQKHWCGDGSDDEVSKSALLIGPLASVSSGVGAGRND